MQINHDQANALLMHSSEVEELEQNSPLFISYFPHRKYLDTKTLKVILCSDVYRRGAAPRYNPSENIIFFANEVHLQQYLLKWGLVENALDEFIEKLEITSEEIVEKIAMVIAVAYPREQLEIFITLLFIASITRRLRKSKFPYITPLGHESKRGFSFVLF
jgi:hypothetical protein